MHSRELLDGAQYLFARHKDFGCDIARFRNLDGLPFDRREVPSETCAGRMMLPMAAGEANLSYGAYIGLFGNLILTNGERSRDRRAITLFTGINGKMKILFSHEYPRPN